MLFKKKLLDGCIHAAIRFFLTWASLLLDYIHQLEVHTSRSTYSCYDIIALLIIKQKNNFNNEPGRLQPEFSSALILLRCHSQYLGKICLKLHHSDNQWGYFTNIRATYSWLKKNRPHFNEMQWKISVTGGWLFYCVVNWGNFWKLFNNLVEFPLHGRR